MRYERVLASLTPADRVHIDDWHKTARVTGSVDARVRQGERKKTGEWISENIQAEEHLNETAFRTFLSGLSGQGPFLGRFNDFVASVTLQGGIAHFPDKGSTLLMRMAPAHLIMRAAFEVNIIIDYPPLEPTPSEWRTFVSTLAYHRDHVPELFQRFLEEGLLAPSEICWATLSSAVEASEGMRGQRNFASIYARLGLNWSCVSEIQQQPSSDERKLCAVLLEYESADIGNCWVPTIADAGWYGRFMPSARDTLCGITCHYWGDPADPTATGLPEIIHSRKSFQVVRDQIFEEMATFEPITLT